MQQHDPVSGTKKAQPVGSLVAGSAGNDELSSPTSVDASASIGSVRTAKKRQMPVSLRVNNNKISNLDDMHEALRAVFDYPGMLQWLDLSGNELEHSARRLLRVPGAVHAASAREPAEQILGRGRAGQVATTLALHHAAREPAGGEEALPQLRHRGLPEPQAAQLQLRHAWRPHQGGNLGKHLQERSRGGSGRQDDDL